MDHLSASQVDLFPKDGPSLLLDDEVEARSTLATTQPVLPTTDLSRASTTLCPRRILSTISFGAYTRNIPRR